MRETEVFL